MTVSESRLMEYTEDDRCMSCGRRLYSADPCLCRRDAAFIAGDAAICEWLEDVLPDPDEQLTRAQRSERDMLLNAANAAHSRQRRRAQHAARPLKDGPGTMEDDERQAFRAYDPRPPKWHPPSTKFTERALREPI